MGGAVDDFFDSAGDVTGIQPAKINDVVESVGAGLGEVAGATLDVVSGGALSGAFNGLSKIPKQYRNWVHDEGEWKEDDLLELVDKLIAFKDNKD